jgi:acetyltransferase
MADLKSRLGKPLLCCWMGDASVGEAREVLADASIPSFRTPEAAVGAFGNIASFYENQQLLQQTPPPLSTLAQPDIEGARLLIENVLAERRQVLTEMESKALLSAFHIPGVAARSRQRCDRDKAERRALRTACCRRHGRRRSRQ